MDHIVSVRSTGDSDAIFVTVVCSCGTVLAQLRSITLDELSMAAHEHIETADRTPITR